MQYETIIEQGEGEGSGEGGEDKANVIYALAVHPKVSYQLKDLLLELLI